MTEVLRIHAGTKLRKNAKGKVEPCADDDPTAEFETLDTVVVVDGRQVRADTVRLDQAGIWTVPIG